MRAPFVIGAVLILSLGQPALAQDDVEMEIVKSGTFEGRSDHETTGGVTVQRIDGAWVLVLEPDFEFDGAPDPKLAFGNGDFDPSTVFTPLKSNSGLQDYMVPERIDPALYSDVWLWCEEFNVPLGVASLE